MHRGLAVTHPSTQAHVHHFDVRDAMGAFSRVAYIVMRVGVALLFMQHGLQKLFGMFGGDTVPLMSQMGLAGVLELFGGALLVLGLLTRPVALVLAIEMIVAYVQAHLPKGGFPIENHGELALLYAFVFLFLAGHGGGPASVDRRLGHV